MITEALLEMHYHGAIRDLMARTFGKKVLRILKPSTQMERWLGFDQAWYTSELDDETFRNELIDAIKKGQRFEKLYFGIFLQFKQVYVVSKRSKHIPIDYTTPYFRTDLSLRINHISGLSQHETLRLLLSITNSNVYYACPMLFDKADIYNSPNLNQLRVIDVRTSPSGWLPEEKHFITFKSPTDPTPNWCSEPLPTSSLSLPELLNLNKFSLFTAKELLNFLDKIKDAVLPYITDSSTILGKYFYPESLTIYEFDNQGQQKLLSTLASIDKKY